MPKSKNINRMFCILVVLYLIESLILGWFAPEDFPVAGILLLSQGLIILVPVIYCFWKKVPITQLIPIKGMRPAVWILVIVCTYLMYPLLIVLNALTLFFVESGAAELSQGLADGNFLVATLLMAVLPACVEEFLFRGLLFGTYRRSKRLAAIFLSALLFGLMHMNLNQFLYAFALGIYMAFLVEATGSIFSSMLAHFTINFTATILSFALSVMNRLTGSGVEDSSAQLTGQFLENMDSGMLMVMIIGICFWGMIALGTTAGAVGVYVAITRLSGRTQEVKALLKGRQGDRERLITIPLVVAVVILVAVIIRQVVAV